MQLPLLCLVVLVLLCSPGCIPQRLSSTPAIPDKDALSPSQSEKQTPPYLEYRLYGGSVIIDPELPPVLPDGQADYASIFDRYSLCDLIISGQVDEVWLWVGNGDGILKGDWYEWTVSGPGWKGAAPDCGRVAATMAFNFSREVDVALESYAHRVEGFLAHYYPCEFATAGWPWKGEAVWGRRCGGEMSDRLGFVARPSASNDYTAACGDAHHPPNIFDAEEYRYDSPLPAASICTSWSRDGSASPIQIDCTAWGCTQRGYLLWWFQNLPGLNNSARDRQGNPLPNWWEVMFDAGSQQAALDRRFPEMDTPDPAWPVLRPSTTSPQSAGRTYPPVTSYTASLPAIRRPVVFALAFPAYGEPRAEFNVLNAEMIELLKQASTYHGYAQTQLEAQFWGQEDVSLAGPGCNGSPQPGNVHIRLTGLRLDSRPARIRIEEPQGGSSWANPCDPISNWQLFIHYNHLSQADLYFKPNHNIPAGAIYTVTVEYEDGEVARVSLPDTSAQALNIKYLGQDGAAFAGQDCSQGSPLPDNLHFHLSGLNPGQEIRSVRLEDPQGSSWSSPCEPGSSILAFIIPGAPGEMDIFIKPNHRNPPDTIYLVSVEYQDGTRIEGAVLAHGSPAGD